MWLVTVQFFSTGPGKTVGVGWSGEKEEQNKMTCLHSVCILFFTGEDEQKGTFNLEVDITDSVNIHLQTILGMFLLRHWPN